MTKVRAVALVRVSTATQERDGFGLDAQRAAVQKWARKENVRLVAVHSEQVSGAAPLTQCQGLMAALADLEAGKADLLLVARADRLSRTLLGQETVCARLAEAGKRVVAVEGGDLQGDGDPTRTLLRQVLGAVAEYDRAAIKARMSAGKAAKKAAGGFVGGMTPMGTRSERGVLVPVQHEAAAVELARALRAEGRSLREIAAELDAAGHRPRRAAVWHPMVVRGMVDREVPVPTG